MRPIYEECGVFGIWHPGGEATLMTMFGLVALQHRGQESAGIVWDKDGLRIKKGLGLVEDAFRGWHPGENRAQAAIGHVRYSTCGAATLANGQPLLFNSRLGSLALAHNGNLVNAKEIRDQLELQGSIFQTDSDSEVIAHLLARSTTELDSALVSALGQVRGAYALVLLTPGRMLAIRDPHGIRPLVLGKLSDGGWVVASETCALDTVGAEFVREVEPGEMLSITEQGLEASSLLPAKKNSFCIFEYIYFARPDSAFAGGNVHTVRRQMGHLLAKEAPADADIVTGVPDSSLSAAVGYAEGSGLPYETGLVRNRYLGRTFIRPSQEQRDQGVSLKLNPIQGVVADKRVVLVDDSLVRGTTSKRLVTMLRQAGAREVHLRIASPPVRYPCGLGIDTRDDLIAARMDVEEIRKYIDADSLVFLSEEQTVAATGLAPDSLCTGCFSGNHPVRRG
ncbi:MAG: amidophosphoribosyltransferase [Firmicutes bacterium]|nr:amidophosphoribosyltransferase [Bacillota bacterium]